MKCVGKSVPLTPWRSSYSCTSPAVPVRSYSGCAHEGWLCLRNALQSDTPLATATELREAAAGGGQQEDSSRGQAGEQQKRARGRQEDWEWGSGVEGAEAVAGDSGAREQRHRQRQERNHLLWVPGTDTAFKRREVALLHLLRANVGLGVRGAPGVNLLHRPLISAGVSTALQRGCQQN